MSATPSAAMARVQVAAAPALSSRRAKLRLRPLAGFGFAVLLLVVLAALVAPVLAPHDPLAQEMAARLRPPAWSSGDWTHPLGTDHLGRDVLSRVIYGARVSLLVSLLAVVVAGGIGVPAGLLSGYLGGGIDAVTMRLADIQLAIPFLVLTMALVAAFGNGFLNVVAALGVSGWVMYARVVRGETLSLRQRQFVEAARAVGARDRAIMWRHVLPNVRASVVVIATLQISRMIIAEASLSFLGLGIDPQIPSWGGTVADGRDYVAMAWWVSTMPGMALMLTVLAANLVGDWLRDRWDPRVRQD